MKKSIALLLSALTSTCIFAISWPQTPTTFAASFGQLRGGTICNSLIFEDSSEVTTVDNGKVVAIISEHDDDMVWFESTLGNAVIVAHENQVCSVYANLDANEIPAEIWSADDIDSGTTIGKSGNSNWHDKENALEFQMIDTKNQAMLNPRILLSKQKSEADKIAITGVTALSSKGESYNFLVRRSLPAGTYKIYRDSQSDVSQYKTTVTVNVVAVETISYDTLQQYKGRLCVSKKKFYPSEVIYPDDSRQLLAEVQLTRGKINLAIIITDVFGNEKATSFALDIN